MGDRLWRATRWTVAVLGVALVTWVFAARQSIHDAFSPSPGGPTDREGAAVPGGAPVRPAVSASSVRDTADGSTFADPVKRLEFSSDAVRLTVPSASPSASVASLGIQTRRIAAGTTTLYEASPTALPAKPRRFGTRVTYDRPGGIVEAYDDGGRRVEQSFILSSPPPAGELVIDVAVDTTLAARPHQAPKIDPRDFEKLVAHNLSLDYVDAAGRGVVSLGKAWAWDEAGSTTPVDVTAVGGGYRMTLSAAWLAGATYPVTVDPAFLLVDSGPGDVANGGANSGHGMTAVAYSTTNNSFMLVIQYKNIDWDMECAPLNADGTFAGPIRQLDTGEGVRPQPDDVWPDIGYSPTSNTFCVVWLEEGAADDDPTVGTLTKLRYALLNPNGTLANAWTNGTLVDLGLDATYPNDDLGTLAGAVCGPKVTWTATGNRFLTTWRDGRASQGAPAAGTVPNHGIRGLFINPTQGAKPVVIDTSGFRFAHDGDGIKDFTVTAFAPMAAQVGVQVTLTATVQNTNAAVATLGSAVQFILDPCVDGGSQLPEPCGRAIRPLGMTAFGAIPAGGNVQVQFNWTPTVADVGTWDIWAWVDNGGPNSVVGTFTPFTVTAVPFDIFLVNNDSGANNGGDDVTGLDIDWNPACETGLFMLAFTRASNSKGSAAQRSDDVWLKALTPTADTDVILTNNAYQANSAKLVNVDPRPRIAADRTATHPVWLTAWEDARNGGQGGSAVRAVFATAAPDPANPAPAAEAFPVRVFDQDFVYGDSPRLDVNPVVAWDPTRDDFLVAWQSITTGTISDVVGRRMDYGGDFLSDIFDVSTPTGTHLMAIRPSVAFNTATNAFLVAFVSGNDAQFFGADDDTHATVVAPPDAPTGLAGVAAGTGTITWTWTDNSAAPNNEQGFRIKDGSLTMATTAADAVTVDETGLAENTRYVRTVVAFNEFGESAPSNSAAVFTAVRAPTTADFTVTLPAMPLCRTQVNLTLTPPPNACSPYPAVAHVPALGRPKGIASGLTAGGLRMFLAVADAPWIYVIDPAQNDQVVDRIDTRMQGPPPNNNANGVAFDAAGGVNKLFVVGSGGMQVLNADTKALIQGGLCAGTQPFGMAAAAGSDRIFIAGFLSNSAHTYNTDTLALVGNECSVDLTPDATGQACPPAGCSPSNPPVVRAGEEPDLVAALDNRGFLAFHDHGATPGGVGSIGLDGNISGWVTTGNGAYGVAVHGGRNRLYVGHRGTNFISVLDTATDPPTLIPAAQITLPAVTAYGLAVDEAANRLFVYGAGNNFHVFDISTDTAVLQTTFTLDPVQNGNQDGGQFIGLANQKAYVPSFNSSRYFVVNSTAACTGAALRIERSIDNGLNWIQIYDGPFVAAFNDVGLAGGTNYCYRITWKNGDNVLSQPSSSTCVVTCANDLIIQSCAACACAPGVAGPDPAVCALPDGTEGALYSQTIVATGGVKPYAWTITPTSPNFPFSLQGVGNDAVISGLAPAGTYTFTLTVTDAQNLAATDVRDFSVTIQPPNPALPPTITSTSPLPPGTVGQAYSFTFTAVNGQPPYTWSVTAGALPPGLTLNQTTGVLAGTPTTTAGSPFLFTITATSATGLVSAPVVFSLSINPYGLTITTASLPGGSVGSAYSAPITATGGIGPTYTWSVIAGALPPGLALGGTGLTATLSGTPTTAGTYNFTVQIADDGQPGVTANRAFSVVITTQGSQALTITTASLPGATVGQPYVAQLAATGGAPAYSWTLVGSTLPPGLSLNPGSGQITGTPTTAGTWQITVQVTDSASPAATAQKSFSLSVSGLPSISTANPLPNAIQNQGYFAQLNAITGSTPVTWSIVGGTKVGTTWTGGGLPAGLSLSETSGAIGGVTADPAATYTFTVQVTDRNGGAGTKLFSLTVLSSPSPVNLIILTNQLPPGQVGVPYSTTLVAAGGVPPYTWSVILNALPAWATFNATLGTITGTPTGPSSTQLQFRVTDTSAPALTRDSVVMTLDILDPLAITTASLPDGGTNALYACSAATTLAATGGTQPYTWTITAGTLPVGLNLNGVTGCISGQPSQVGTGTFTARVTDAFGRTAQRQLSITIVASLTLPGAPPVPRVVRTAGFCWADPVGAGAAAWVAAAVLLAAARRTRRR